MVSSSVHIKKVVLQTYTALVCTLISFCGIVTKKRYEEDFFLFVRLQVHLINFILNVALVGFCAHAIHSLVH